MKLQPYTAVDGLPFSATRADVLALRGEPQLECRNAASLTELDYGDVVYRFQDSGRLEEVTRRAPVLYLGPIDVPFAALDAFVRARDTAAFSRGGFVVSPRFGLAYVPQEPDWVTALAEHCIETWRLLPER